MEAPPQTLALDLSRLFAGALRLTPRGIDRVELLYARHFLSTWPGPCFSVATTPWGPRLFDRRRALRGVQAIEALWGEGEGAPVRPGRRIVQAAMGLLRIGPTLGQSAERVLPQGATYLNVGHVGLSRGLQWLDRRSDVAPVFMLHDLIPLEHPHQVSHSERDYFARIVDNLRFARGLILNSATVAAAYGRLRGAQPARIVVSRLPVAPIFLSPAPEANTSPAPYFVACGQVEHRKNLQLLVETWRRLGLEGGGASASLLIVGADGEASADVKQSLDAWDPSGLHVRRVRNLTTRQLRDLVAGATALLAPSLAEGFGLPIVEALSLGVPVIASDIPAHREVAADHATYLDPRDPQAWLSAIRPLLGDPAALGALRAKTAGFRPRTSHDYFQDIEGFLRGFAAGPRP